MPIKPQPKQQESNEDSMDNLLSNKKDLIKLLDELLAPFSFKRLKDDWYLDKQDCILVVGLGKSLYGGQFNLAVALLLKELSPELLPHPPYHLCHFRQSSQFIVPNWDEVKTVLDLENNLPAKYRIDKIAKALKGHVLPMIMRVATQAAIAHEIKFNRNFEPYCDLAIKLFLQQRGFLEREDLRIETE